MVFGVLVFGGLFSGFSTVTEAGAVGAAGAILIAALLRRFDGKALKMALLETLSTTSALLIISVGTSMFTLFLTKG
ncbi:TRAP transporter large permease subunit [Halomonas cerina]|uniref:TRAP-type mannitol/chloroaromatic compound transport system permease large subunit n=1 Tax=Halomonas cerina TaxID=447424 RepID=A0A839VGX2_9GAMM|nr:TRAP transporter large permease subunit [Halomonas cerina]MBB3191927.1 TRAP-type mannitol/chloroaromatic compound transport system permease large subunit [Halomonas cerina]